jgi:hypothetical protein
VSSEREGNVAGELRLAPESIEALALRLAELLGSAPAPRGGNRQRISAAEVARLWGVARRWVYDHADELGASRLGSGPRPRLRFDPDEVAERLGEPTRPVAPRGDRRRSAPMRGDCRTDSLSPRRRAMVGRQLRKRPGRRANAPRPGAEIAAQ